MWTDLRLTAFRCLFCCFVLDAACSERPPTGWQSAVDCFLIGRYKLGRFLLCNVSAAPGWPPGRFFRHILGGTMRDNGQLETAYLMLEPGKHLCLKVQEPESIPTRYSKTVYHGTSLGALEKIMGEGFRPSRGAGSDEVGKKYGCSLPMVYTSGLLETAHGYVGNVDNGQRIGSGQHLGPKVNCVVWMKADPEGRLFRKKPVKTGAGSSGTSSKGTTRRT